MVRLLSTGRARPKVSFIDIAHAGRSYRVALKRVSRARRFTLRVRTATRDAVLTMPSGSSVRAARSFAERHAAWIGVRMKRLPDAVPLWAGSTVPLRGCDVAIVHCRGLRAAAWLGPGPVIWVTGAPEQQQRRVLDLLRREARQDFEVALRRYAAAVGKTVAAVRLRDTRSRWGSCTARGSISVSWRLVMAPPHVLDYLAAHEVAHLVEMNHSAAYWAVVATLMPDFATAEAWLKRHGTSLHRYGADASAP